MGRDEKEQALPHYLRRELVTMTSAVCVRRAPWFLAGLD